VTTVTREHPGLDVGHPPESFHLQILGPLRVWRDGTRAGNPVSMSEIVDLLWGVDAPLSAVNTVHKYVGALRRILEPDLGLRASGRWLVRHGPGYRFNANPDVLDLTAFRRAADAARHSLAQGDDARALKSRVKALRLWHGPAGGGLAETPDAQTIFDTLNREYLDLAVSSAQLARRRKRPRLVLDLLWQAAAVGPLHEPLHAELIANLTLAGHNAEALAAYRAIRDRLASELGIDPSPGLQLAYHEIGTAPVPPPREDTPGDGIRRKRPAQLPADLPSFVGRTGILSQVRDLLTQRGSAGRTAAIVAFDGMPGIGKTVLALRLAHEFASAYPDGQLHLDLRGFAEVDRPVTAEEALRDLISGLGVEQWHIPDGRQAMAGLYRTLLRNRRVLIVLDDARSTDQVVDLLPSSPGCLVFLTSRRRMPALRTAAGAYPVPVGLPEHDEARAQLARHSAQLHTPACR
jgi:DNA-binding SARP family transcriptional activator